VHQINCQALIRKLHAAKVQPSESQGNTVQTRLISGKNFCQIWKADHIVVRPDGAYVFQAKRSFEPAAYK
jgi:hypothetical protein